MEYYLKRYLAQKFITLHSLAIRMIHERGNTFSFPVMMARDRNFFQMLLTPTEHT